MLDLSAELSQEESDLKKQIIKYRRFAFFMGGICILPIIYIGFYSYKFGITPADSGAYLGGMTAPFASLAGMLFVYVGFLGQRLSIIYQRADLAQNRDELAQTREEFRGQKEQMILQNQNFEKDLISNFFFRLLDNHRDIRGDLKYVRFWNSSKKVVEKREGNRDPLKSAFIVLSHIHEDQKIGWSVRKIEELNQIYGLHMFPIFRIDFSPSNGSFEEYQFLLKLASNEEVFGAYYRIVGYIIEFIYKNNKREFLEIFEAQMTKFERVYLYYWCLSRLPQEQLEFIKNHRFLYSIDHRHFINPNHLKFIYPDKFNNLMVRNKYLM